MRSYNNNIKRANPFVLLNVSIYILSAICLMIYATQQSYVHADENLGYDITSANASVTVGTACTFTATVDNEHNATIANGIYSTDIGKTTLNTICNDSGGYAVYAIGYTEDTYGATDLASNISSTYNISTGTNTSGDSSSWAMKLSPEPGTTTATIENGYNNYNIVPDDYTKVASLNTVTGNTSTTSTTGSSISTTYQAYISPTQPAGTYTGKVKYTLVHPSTAPAPVFMQDTAKIKTLLTNYGDTMQAIDKRDGKKYWITKLADGNIWMTQNLDLDLDTGTTLTPANTNISADWIPINGTTAFAGASASDWNDDYNMPYSADPGDAYYYSSSTTNDDSRYSSLEACQAVHPDCGMHNHVGNYYNWSAAVASNNTSTMTTKYSNAPDSICPAGWRLPIARDNSNTAINREWSNLLAAEGIITNPTDSSYATDGFNNIRKSPLWLVRPGYIHGGSIYGAGSGGNYWSSTVNNNEYAYLLYFSSGGVNPADHNNRLSGYSIRCMVE